MTFFEVLKHNLYQLAISIDQDFNVIVSTFYKEKGFADITLSANAYRWDKLGIRSTPRKIIDALFFWQKNHCYSAYLSEIERKHMPEDSRYCIHEDENLL